MIRISLWSSSKKLLATPLHSGLTGLVIQRMAHHSSLENATPWGVPKNPPKYPHNPPPNDVYNFKVQTIDDLPSPQGDWTEDYQKKQAKYNRHLIQGIVMFLLPVFYIYQFQPVLWNFFPPEMPPKEERITSFWEEPEDDE